MSTFPSHVLNPSINKAHMIPSPQRVTNKPGKIRTIIKTARAKFVLASTMERVELPDDIVGQLSGKSTVARLGLTIHAVAGYVDPGFETRVAPKTPGTPGFDCDSALPSGQSNSG